MKDIIDTDLTAHQSTLDFQTICKWLLIGILGCVVFQGYEYFLKMIFESIINSIRAAGFFSSYLLGDILSLLLLLPTFYIVIQTLRQRYKSNKINTTRLVKQLIGIYIIIYFLEFGFPFFSDFIGLNVPLDTPELIVSRENWAIVSSIYFTIETIIQYGFITYILLRRS